MIMIMKNIPHYNKRTDQLVYNSFARNEAIYVVNPRHQTPNTGDFIANKVNDIV